MTAGTRAAGGVFYLVLPLVALAAARAALGCRTRSRRVTVLLAPPLLLLLIGLSGKYMAGVVVPGAPGADYGANSGQLGYPLETTAVGLAAALLIAAVTLPGGPERGPLLQRILELPAVVTETEALDHGRR